MSIFWQPGLPAKTATDFLAQLSEEGRTVSAYICDSQATQNRLYGTIFVRFLAEACRNTAAIDEMHRIHSVDYHTELLRIASDLETHNKENTHCGYHEGIMDCVLTALNYHLRFGIRNSDFRTQCANTFLDGCHSLWTTLWKQRLLIYRFARPSDLRRATGGFDSILADAVIHYVLLHIRIRNTPPPLTREGGVARFALDLWANIVSPLPSESLICALSLLFSSRYESNTAEVRMYWNYHVLESYGVQPSKLRSKFRRELSAEEVLDVSLIRLLDFLRATKFCAIWEIFPELIRDVLGACKRQLRRGNKQYLPRVLHATFHALRLFFDDHVEKNDRTWWNPLGRILYAGRCSLGLVDLASHALLSAASNALTDSVTVVDVIHFVLIQHLRRLRAACPDTKLPQDFLVQHEQVWRQTFERLQLSINQTTDTSFVKAASCWNDYGKQLEAHVDAVEPPLP